MKSARNDALDNALRVLAGDDALEFPDATLEDRLRVVHDQEQAAASWVRRLRPPLSRAASLLLFLALSGIAVGATLGFDSIKAWWYSIQVDGETVSGVAKDGAPTTLDYVSEDGYSVSVSVERQRLDEGIVRTEFNATERSDKSITETSEVIEESNGSSPEDPPARTFDISVLEEASRLHTWTTDTGESRSLWLGPDFEGAGSWLLLERPDTEVEGPVELLLSTARPIAAGGHVSIRQLGNGALRVELSDGKGWAIALAIAAPDQAEQPPLPIEFTTPSGRVRVQAGD